MEIEIIKPDVLVDLQVSPGFLTRLHELLTWMITNQEPDRVRAANEKLTRDEELDEWEEHYATMLSLIHSVEEAAREQQKTELVRVREGE